jgi:PKD repeat protein
MRQKKIIGIIICLLIISVNYSVTATIFTKKTFQKIENSTLNIENQDKLMLVRIPYSEYNFDFLKNNDYEIVEYIPDEWIDILIKNEDLGVLSDNFIKYKIMINDVDAFCDNIRGEYHTFPEIEQILQTIANDHSDITNLFSIGESYEGRDIWCLEITDNPGVDEGEPGVFFIGLHHAREWPTVEICLYIANNLTDNYNTDPDITSVVNNRRLWIVPCENPDGYVYSHDQGHDMWRKNRRYFPEWNSYGVDPNRNYGGSSNGDIWGSWGSIGDARQTHDPDDDLFCGPWSESENCTQTIKNFFIQKDICALISWHTYSELVLWPWSYSIDETTPDNTYLSQVGTTMASLITQQDGTGTYSPGQGASLYPTTGDTTDWAYGYSHYVLGRPTFAYTIEACTSFHPSEGYLDQVCRENYDAGFYLLQEAENISNITPRVIPPIITDMSNDSDGDYNVTWIQQNTAADPDYYQLDELSNLILYTDDAESGSNLWTLDGFELSTARSYSSTHSFKSRYSNYDVSGMTTNYPIPIIADMNLSFWCWYNIENNYDMAFVEVSTDNRYFTLLDTFTGSSSGWVYKEYSLEDWINESVFLRFRYTTDANTQNEGFYVDDIYPIPDFDIVNTLSNTLTTTYYNIYDNPDGVYYYRVKGHNTKHGWGDFSTLESITVSMGSNLPPIANFVYSPTNPTTNDLIQFTDTSTDLDGTITNWFWDFGDGNTSNIQNPSHTYQNKGSYSVVLTVTDNDGYNNTKIVSIYIRKYGPNADFSYSPNHPIKNQQIQFTDESYDTSGGIISSWYWEFGDDNTSYLQNPTHTYSINGSYQVNLTVTNNTGIIDSISKTLYIGLINVYISLINGWNLITIPAQTGWWASDIADNLTGCTSVSRWDAVNQTYYTYIVGGPPTFDFPIMGGHGYFIDMTDSDTLSISGHPINSVNIPLKVGWNLLGWYHEYDTTASSLSENITGCTTVSIWNATLQTYDTYIVGGPPTFDFTITCGMGLFVDVTTESTWLGEG